MHTHTHTYIHTYIHDSLSLYIIHIFVHTYKHTYIHTHTHTYIHTYMHAYTHNNNNNNNKINDVCVCACVCVYIYSGTYTVVLQYGTDSCVLRTRQWTKSRTLRARKYTIWAPVLSVAARASARAYTHTHTHTHTYTHTRIHAYTHTHTHTHSVLLWLCTGSAHIGVCPWAVHRLLCGYACPCSQAIARLKPKCNQNLIFGARVLSEFDIRI